MQNKTFFGILEVEGEIMKNILLTNFMVKEFTGSEIDTVTMANHFLKIGYSVDIFTINYGYPLLEKLNKKVRVLSYRESDKLKKHYDLMWSHHFPLLDYLIFNKKIKIDYIHYISLSSFEPYECPPFYYEELNKISVLSVAAIKCLAEEGYKTENFGLFSNGATQDFFDKAKKSYSDELSKICIVSNHVPKELYEFKQIANNNKILVDIFGKGDTFVDITPELLVNYDLIISIGKTINYGLALKVPCYCYDHFGGDLYITKENVKKSHEYNFSGRRLKIKKTAQELYDDIIANYKNALKDVTDCQKYAYDNFCTENQIKKSIAELKKTSKFDTTKICDKYPTMKRRSELFVREASNLYIKFNNIQIFQSDNENFTEEKSTKYYYEKDKIMKFDYKVEKNNKYLRIDFANHSLVLLNKILINNKPVKIEKYQNVRVVNNKYISLNDDPQLYVNINLKKESIITFELHLDILSLEQYQDLYNNVCD